MLSGSLRERSWHRWPSPCLIYTASKHTWMHYLEWNLQPQRSTYLPTHCDTVAHNSHPTLTYRYRTVPFVRIPARSALFLDGWVSSCPVCSRHSLRSTDGLGRQSAATARLPWPMAISYRCIHTQSTTRGSESEEVEGVASARVEHSIILKPHIHSLKSKMPESPSCEDLHFREVTMVNMQYALCKVQN